MSKIKSTIPDRGEFIEIRAQRYTLDWVDEKAHKIYMNEIMGFELHYRGDSWHVRVITRTKDTEDKFYSYDLDHWVFPVEISKLLGNPKAKILRIVNYWGSEDFLQQIANVLHYAKPQPKT